MSLLHDPVEADGTGGDNSAWAGYVHDPTDPIPEEVARRMPPPVRFTGQKFLDPADTFKKAANRVKESE